MGAAEAAIVLEVKHGPLTISLWEKENWMSERDILKRRIQICRTLLVIQTVAVLALSVAVWNPSDAHRHLFNVLWYASLFIWMGPAIILGKRISGAKTRLDTLNHSVDL